MGIEVFGNYFSLRDLGILVCALAGLVVLVWIGVKLISGILRLLALVFILALAWWVFSHLFGGVIGIIAGIFAVLVVLGLVFD